MKLIELKNTIKSKIEEILKSRQNKDIDEEYDIAILLYHVKKKKYLMYNKYQRLLILDFLGIIK